MNKRIKHLLAISAIGFSTLFSSCIYDDEGDCSVRYHVPFNYSLNIMDDDAFASQVTSVTLYVYDTSGNLVLKKTEGGDILKTPGYTMQVDLKPGNYSMVAWCEGKPSYTNPAKFAIDDSGNTLRGLTATLPLKGTDPDQYSDQDIVPLFHGYNATVECPDTYGDVTLPVIDLTKDTNIFEVVLQNLEGTVINEGDFTIYIEAQNNTLSWDNKVTGTTNFSYLPWYTAYLATDTKAEDAERVTGMMVEMTTGRLMVGRSPHLVVRRNSDNTKIINLDLITNLLSVKGHYPRPYTNQEYLDAVDRFRFIFVIDPDHNWYTAEGININGWKVVAPQDMDL